MVDMTRNMALVTGKRLPLTWGFCLWMPRRMALTAWVANKDGLLGSRKEVKCWMPAR